jgi:hypothetical protein
MTVTEKRKFIRDLTKSIAKTAIGNAARMPQAWDGHELRDYLADLFEGSRSRLMTEKRSARRRAYAHDCQNLNL